MRELVQKKELEHIQFRQIQQLYKIDQELLNRNNADIVKEKLEKINNQINDFMHNFTNKSGLQMTPKIQSP